MPAQAKRRRTSTSSGPTPLKPSLMSPVTPREPESSDGAATAEAEAFKPPPAKKRPKKRKKKAAKPKKKKSAPPPDSDSDSDDGLSLAELLAAQDALDFPAGWVTRALSGGVWVPG